VGTRVGGRQQRIAQLCILEDLVGHFRRDVAAKGLPEDLFPPANLRFELCSGGLSAHGSGTHQGFDVRPQGFIQRH
jgi:hypothetical protein